MEQQNEMFFESFPHDRKVERKSLLPTWMKVFIWIFLIAGALASLCLLAGIAGLNFPVALYGLEDSDGRSPLTIFILLLLLLKGMVAFGLWTEKSWAVKLGIVDAIIGIGICTYMMVISPFLNHTGFVVSLRLELVALIPYLIKLNRIKAQWEYN